MHINEAVVLPGCFNPLGAADFSAAQTRRCIIVSGNLTASDSLSRLHMMLLYLANKLPCSFPVIYEWIMFFWNPSLMVIYIYIYIKCAIVEMLRQCLYVADTLSLEGFMKQTVS